MIASTVMELICTDLKFKDQQYDTQYVLLNSKLKNHRKNEKIKNKHHKKEKQPKIKEERNRNQSKFHKKYSERIRDIQNSDQIRERNKKIFEETGSLYQVNARQNMQEKAKGNYIPKRQKPKH